MSGLLTCGNCGGKLTVAGSGKSRRYYCANAKEKGATDCSGMPALKEDLAAETILGNLRGSLFAGYSLSKIPIPLRSATRGNTAPTGRCATPVRRGDQTARTGSREPPARGEERSAFRCCHQGAQRSSCKT
ncbi:zinc ribbon domain-containing protein [Ruegeria sp. B32]|uniref:zinc ribbon domain-containing protein n=1 Tax=Ruegeria sp. B32 TaxID=2867020 RepID=UPI0021A39F6C|nr:zinc ribbon domain-containing protein [Ruegeria sp. B32]